MTQIWTVLELDTVGGRVVKIATTDSNIGSGLQDRQSLPRPESELRLEEKLVTEVGDGLRAVLGTVSEQRNRGGRQGGCDDPGTGQGGAVLQGNSSSTTGGHLEQQFWLDVGVGVVSSMKFIL